MRSEKWSTKSELEHTFKSGASGAVMYCDRGNIMAYDGEGHTMYVGVSGTGKSRCGTIPAVRTFILNGESAVIADAKGEIYKYTKDMIPDHYDVHVIDFRHLFDEKAEGWNPLEAPYRHWKKGTPESIEIAEKMIEELSHSMYIPSKDDPFWGQEARNVFLAAVYALFELGTEDQINLASVYYMIAQGDERIGSSTFLKEIEELLKDNEKVAMQLHS